MICPDPGLSKAQRRLRGSLFIGQFQPQLTYSECQTVGRGAAVSHTGGVPRWPGNPRVMRGAEGEPSCMRQTPSPPVCKHPHPRLLRIGLPRLSGCPITCPRCAGGERSKPSAHGPVGNGEDPAGVARANGPATAHPKARTLPAEPHRFEQIHGCHVWARNAKHHGRVTRICQDRP